MTKIMGSVSRQIHTDIAETATTVAREQVQRLTSEFLRQAKQWWQHMPDGKWSVHAARSILPGVGISTADFAQQVGAIFRAEIDAGRRRSYLSGLTAHQVTMALMHHVPQRSIAEMVQTPLGESQRTDPLDRLIDAGITGDARQVLCAAIERYVPPQWWSIPTRIRWMTDTTYGGVHGAWNEQTREIVLAPDVVSSQETFGEKNEPQLSRVAHTIIHEFAHAWGTSNHMDDTPEWLGLSGWQFQTGPVPAGKARYVERRAGWPRESSPWVHDARAWFLRPYSAKSPAEDFADCVLFLLAGWGQRFDGGGEAKRAYVAQRLPGSSESIMEPPSPELCGRRAVSRVVIREGGNVWLYDPRDEPLVMLPGGGVADGETWQAAAIREAKEETGFDVRIVQYLMDGIDEYSVRRFYRAERIGGQPTTQDTDGGEQVRIRRVPIARALELLTSAFDQAAVRLTQG